MQQQVHRQTLQSWGTHSRRQHGEEDSRRGKREDEN